MVSQASTWVLHGFVLNFLWTSAKTINWWPVKNIFPTALIKSATLGSISFSRQPSFSSRITPATPARKIKQLPYGLMWQIRRTTCTTMSTIVIGLKVSYLHSRAHFCSSEWRFSTSPSFSRRKRSLFTNISATSFMTSVYSATVFGLSVYLASDWRNLCHSGPTLQNKKTQ